MSFLENTEEFEKLFRENIENLYTLDIVATCEDKQITGCEFKQRVKEIEQILSNVHQLAVIGKPSIDIFVIFVVCFKNNIEYIPLANFEEYEKKYAGISFFLNNEFVITKGIRKQPNDIAYRINTSGTTGVPKEICITYKSVYNLFYKNFFIPDKIMNVMSISNIAFDASILEYMVSIIKSATLRIYTQSLLDKNEVNNFINKNKVDFAIIMTPLFLKLLDLRVDLVNVANILFGGQKLIISLEQENEIIKLAQKTNIYHVYGMTEHTIISTYNRVINDVYDIGREIVPHTVEFQKRENNLYEIFLVGEQCSKGSKKGIASKDIVQEKSGKYYFFSRQNSFIKRHGYRVSIEKILSKYKELNPKKEIYILNFGEVLVLFTTEKSNFLHPKQKIDNADIIIEVDEMKINRNGKIDTQFLREQYYRLNKEHLIENALDEIFEICKKSRDDKYTSLNDLSISSIEYMSVYAHLIEKYKLNIHISNLFDTEFFTILEKIL